MSRLNTFIPPQPNPLVMTLMSFVNRCFIVGSFPGFKHLGPRPLTRITEVNFSTADQRKLRSLVCAADTAVFITPNHPEFFTDWMLDNYLLRLTAPRAASWATHTIVNGMGRLAQWFWLANNLIAQIPRVTETAKFHSMKIAARGDGVLLHPEGSVGWHSNYIGPMFSGAIDMALRVQEYHPEILSSYVAPVVWKLVFTGDVTDGLLAEYRYLCRQLQLVPNKDFDPAQAIYHIYEELLARDEALILLAVNRNDSVWERLPLYLTEASAELGELVFSTEQGPALLLAARAWQSNNQTSDERSKSRKVQLLLSSIERWQKFLAHARRSNTVTQEELAEHQKRLRAELCVDGFRNTLNKFVPISVGPRHAFVRVLEPFLMPELELQTRNERATLVDNLTLALRVRLQLGLDDLNAELSGCFISYSNPFF